MDALLNASMILAGMGPVSPVTTDAGKVFAACYALFSGIVFLAASGVAFAPVVHRFLHRFHLETEQDFGKEMPTLRRDAKLLFRGKFLNYPLNIRNILFEIPVTESLLIVSSYFLRQFLESAKKE